MAELAGARRPIRAGGGSRRPIRLRVRSSGTSSEFLDLPDDTAPELSPAELAAKLDRILETAVRLTRQMPDERLEDLLPNRPRSWRVLMHHVYQIPVAFLDMEERGETLTYEALTEPPPDSMRSSEAVADHGEVSASAIQTTWWSRDGRRGLLRPGAHLLRRHHPARDAGTHRLAHRAACPPDRVAAGAGRAWRRTGRWPPAISGACPSPTRSGTRAECPPQGLYPTPRSPMPEAVNEIPRGEEVDTVVGASCPRLRADHDSPAGFGMFLRQAARSPQVIRGNPCACPGLGREPHVTEIAV